MKNLFFIFILFCTLAIYAQENNPSTKTQEQTNQTVQYVPAQQIPQGQPVYYIIVPQNGNIQPNPYHFFEDSTAYYEEMIQTYTQNGTSKRNAGLGMIVGGSIGVAAGIGFIIAKTPDKDDDKSSDILKNVLGSTLITGGAILFGTGIAFRIVGTAKLNKADRFRQKLKFYLARKQQIMTLHIQPKLDFHNHCYGGQLALNF